MEKLTFKSPTVIRLGNGRQLAQRPGDVPGDHKTGQGQQDKSGEGPEDNGGRRVSSAGLSFVGARFKKPRFLGLHFINHLADFVHGGFALVCDHFGQHGVESLVFAQVNGFAQFAELLADERLKSVESALLIGIVLGQFPDGFDFFVHRFLRALIRLQIPFLAGDDVAALAGFGILHFGKRGFQVFNNLMAVGHPISRTGEFAQALIGDGANGHQNRQGQSKP